jgi:selenoprotein W-related protein
VAAALKDELDVETTLIKGSSGIFEVAVDGKVVACKGRNGFPTEQEVVDAVSRSMGSGAAER